MRHVVVRYTLKPERVAEHEALLARVFEELAAVKPLGLRYEVLKLQDGLSFVHRAALDGEGNPLTALDSFKRFSADVKSRCDVAPLASDATSFGSYSASTIA
jgi:hypothetical protein